MFLFCSEKLLDAKQFAHSGAVKSWRRKSIYPSNEEESRKLKGNIREPDGFKATPKTAAECHQGKNLPSLLCTSTLKDTIGRHALINAAPFACSTTSAKSERPSKKKV